MRIAIAKRRCIMEQSEGHESTRESQELGREFRADSHSKLNPMERRAGGREGREYHSKNKFAANNTDARLQAPDPRAELNIKAKRDDRRHQRQSQQHYPQQRRRQRCEDKERKNNTPGNDTSTLYTNFSRRRSVPNF